MKRAPKELLAAPCVCGKPVVLHLSAHGRRLDCEHARTKEHALAYARAQLKTYYAYIARIQRALGK